MSRRILIINGHPDASPKRFCAALANTYGAAASRSGHAVKRLDLGNIEFPLIRSSGDFITGECPEPIIQAQNAITWADHIVIVFPLWLGGMPALLKGFLEQTLRYGFALSAPGQKMRGMLKGRSVRLIVTMGMPTSIFRLVFASHGLRALERGMLWICGFGPIHNLVVGGVENKRNDARALEKAGRLGALGI